MRTVRRRINVARGMTGKYSVETTLEVVQEEEVEDAHAENGHTLIEAEHLFHLAEQRWPAEVEETVKGKR